MKRILAIILLSLTTIIFANESFLNDKYVYENARINKTTTKVAVSYFNERISSLENAIQENRNRISRIGGQKGISTFLEIKKLQSQNNDLEEKIDELKRFIVQLSDEREIASN